MYMTIQDKLQIYQFDTRKLKMNFSGYFRHLPSIPVTDGGRAILYGLQELANWRLRPAHHNVLSMFRGSRWVLFEIEN